MNRKIILFAFFLAGFTTFVYEIAWARPLQIIFGSTIFAASTILTAFLAGFSIGAFILGRKGDGINNPLKAFAFIQLGIGVYGFLMIGIIRILPAIYIPLSALPGMNFVPFMICFLVLIVPATLMGASWPLVNKSFINPDNSGSGAGILYSSNSLGSSLGPLAAGFFMMPVLGIAATSAAAAVVNLFTAAMVFFFLGREGK